MTRPPASLRSILSLCISFVNISKHPPTFFILLSILWSYASSPPKWAFHFYPPLNPGDPFSPFLLYPFYFFFSPGCFPPDFEHTQIPLFWKPSHFSLHLWPKWRLPSRLTALSFTVKALKTSLHRFYLYFHITELLQDSTTFCFQPKHSVERTALKVHQQFLHCHILQSLLSPCSSWLLWFIQHWWPLSTRPTPPVYLSVFLS